VRFCGQTISFVNRTFGILYPTLSPQLGSGYPREHKTSVLLLSTPPLAAPRPTGSSATSMIDEVLRHDERRFFAAEGERYSWSTEGMPTYR
jgi:hypothetical protein